MKLQDFILSNMELILQAWEDFARAVETPAPMLDAKGLRNHGEFILRTVAADLRTSQTEQQQIDKSHGHGPEAESDAPSKTHAMSRLIAGFSLDQMVSEYRALRSSVLRLWLAHELSVDHQHVQQIIRFNEAIDQALAESIATYGHAVETTRKTVLGVLGHDLRSPLGAITMAGGLLQKAEYLSERERHLSNQICISVGRANEMVDDLLDLARCNLGTGIPVCLETACLSDVCKSAVEELRTAFPSVRIEYEEHESISGLFDPSRIAQVFSNLISNAIRHGDRQQPVRVSLYREGSQSVFCVQNHGETIPADALPHIFSLGARYSSHAIGEKGSTAGLGLGLFIASQIVSGHSGEINVESSTEHGTLFRVHLPVC
jgi:signal transduction histidine kinase